MSISTGCAGAALLLFWLCLLPSSLLVAEVTEEWVSRFECPAGDAFLNDLITDGEDNIILIGECRYEGGFSDFFTLKYNEDGEWLWWRLYDHGDDDCFTSGGVDALGNVYVTGVSRDSYTFRDFATIKYAWDSTERWVDRYDHDRSEEWLHPPRALDVDGQGNVYVTGYSGATSSEIATIKYKPDGSREWVNRRQVPGNEPVDVEVDAAGNVYVASLEYVEGVFARILTIKYDSDGNELWSRHSSGSADEVDALEVDAAGNVYVLGSRYSAPMTQCFLTTKYASTGEELWVRLDDCSSWSQPRASALDAAEGVLVSGRSATDTEDGFLTINYSAGGDERWARIYDCGRENAGDMATDERGMVYVTGTSNCEADHYYVATVKYDADGNEVWVKRFDDPLSSQASYPEVAVDASNNIVVAAIGIDADGKRYLTTVKYVEAAPQLMTEAVEFYEERIEDGLLCGLGATDNAANAREVRFSVMLYDAYEIITSLEPEAACSDLDRLLSRIDGQPSPPDLIGCPAVSALFAMLDEVMQALDC